MKITLDLDKPQRIVDVMRAAALVELDLVAEQIEEQLPKPTPPEPKGDVLVRDDFGVAWIRHEDGYWCGTPGTTNWLALSRKGGRAYRPVPSTEAVEALVQEFANLEIWRSRFREFARRLLCGDQ